MIDSRSCGEEIGVGGRSYGVCGEDIGCRLLWGFLEGVLSGYGKHCSIVVNIIRFWGEASVGFWHAV